MHRLRRFLQLKKGRLLIWRICVLRSTGTTWYTSSCFLGYVFLLARELNWKNKRGPFFLSPLGSRQQPQQPKQHAHTCTLFGGGWIHRLAGPLISDRGGAWPQCGRRLMRLALMNYTRTHPSSSTLCSIVCVCVCECVCVRFSVLPPCERWMPLGRHELSKFSVRLSSQPAQPCDDEALHWRLTLGTVFVVCPVRSGSIRSTPIQTQ